MAGVKRYGILIVGVGAVILTAFTVARGRGVRSGGAPAADGDPPPAPTMVLAEGHVVTHPGATVDVRSELGGRLVLLRVEEQQEVRQGELVAAIAADEAEAALAEAEAQIAAAEVDTAWLATELRRIAPLVETGSMSQQALDRTTHELNAARARRAVAAATARRLKAVLEKTRIVAPIAGTVIARPVAPGEVVAPGTHLMTIADLRRRRVEAEVDEYDAHRVHPGGAVTITAEGYDAQSWKGTVESVADVIAPRRTKPQDPARFSDTRVLLVWVSLPPDAPLKIGQRVELAFHLR